MDELTLLQAVRLKGRARPADLAATLGVEETFVETPLRALGDAGLLVEGAAVRLSPEGRARLKDLLAEERRGLDVEAVARAYDDFRRVNHDFKSLVTDWQLKDGAPNDHADVAYDAALLGRLDETHRVLQPILAAATEQLPRLNNYALKLSAALDKIHAGEAVWFTRPIIDSYHTVWFELHEELIGAAGLTRDDESDAGHAD